MATNGKDLSNDLGLNLGQQGSGEARRGSTIARANAASGNARRGSMAGTNGHARRASAMVAGGAGYERKEEADLREVKQRAEGVVLSKKPIDFTLYLKTRRVAAGGGREIWDPLHPSQDTIINANFNGIVLTNARKIKNVWESFITGLPVGTGVRTIYLFENGVQTYHSGVTISLDNVPIYVNRFTSRKTALVDENSRVDTVPIPGNADDREELSKTIQFLDQRAKESRRRIYYITVGVLGAAAVPGAGVALAAYAPATVAATYTGVVSTLGGYNLFQDGAEVVSDAGFCSAHETSTQESMDIAKRFGDYFLYRNPKDEDVAALRNFTGVLLYELNREPNTGAQYNNFKVYIYQNGNPLNFSDRNFH